MEGTNETRGELDYLCLLARDEKTTSMATMTGGRRHVRGKWECNANRMNSIEARRPRV